VSNGSLAIHSGPGARRSTRITRAIRLAVQGVDVCRGPYHEEVSTVTINCHGCMYESKYEVSPNAFVMLELIGKNQDSTAISARGHVKWTQRRVERGGLCRTAIELDAHGNIWGIDSPPNDWLPFCGPRGPEAGGSKAKTVAVLRPESGPTTTKDDGGKTVPPHSASQQSPATRSTGESIGGFQEQIERMLSEAAEAVVRERATALLDDMRAGLREEAKRVVAEATSLQAGSWIDESLKQMNTIVEESARVRHSQWTKKIEAELQQGLTRLEMRHRELEEISERLTTKVRGQLQGFLEASRKDSVDRIIARLKEQSAPVIEHSRKVLADLTKREEELEKVCQQYVEKSAVQIEESCTRLDRQFEMILRERLDCAREELEHGANAVAKSALNSVRASAQQQETEAQARLSGTLEPVTERALATLKEKAADISREFAGEMSHYGRTYLEFVSGAISELAKGLGKLSNS
jgi:hypothetical protein